MSRITITRDKEKMNVGLIHQYLTRSYWAKGRTRDQVITTMENSYCFAVFSGTEQIGFARVVTDQVVFAWLMDVFIVEGHKGQGIGKRLIAYILNIPELRHVNGIGLRTRDAHGLYEQFGFQKIDAPDTWMLRKTEIRN